MMEVECRTVRSSSGTAMRRRDFMKIIGGAAAGWPLAAHAQPDGRVRRTVPIVFTGAGDPVANGLVRNIARPEGNTTGFSGSEPSVAGKRLDLLKEAAPHVSRVAIVFNPNTI